MNKQKIIIFLLTGGLFLSGQYIVLDKWSQTKQEEIEKNFQNGHDLGVKEVIMTLYEQTNDCHVTTIKFANLTRSLFDISCIQNVNRSSNH